MKKKELFDALHEIDPSYILDAAPKEEKILSHFPAGLARWGVAAACLILLLCAVPVAKRLMNGATPGVIPPDSQPVTDVVENPDFVIKDGVLLSYVGNDPHVVVPDEVVEISRDAFAEKGDIIDTITIGKNVEVVDYLFLSKVDHLSGVVVEKENERFEVYEGVFIDKDNSVFIQTSNNRQLDLERFIHVAEQINDEKLYLGETCELTFGKATIVLRLERFTHHATGEEITQAHFSEITFKGTTIQLNDDPVQYNAVFRLYQNDDMLLFDHVERYLLTKDKVYDLNREYDLLKEPDAPCYQYSQDENSVIRYVMQPIKYPIYPLSLEDLTFGLRRTTGLDDFFKEEGYITIENGDLCHVPTATYTMETGGKLDDYIAAFEQCRNAGEPFYEKFNSIEELFAYNKSQQSNVK